MSNLTSKIEKIFNDLPKDVSPIHPGNCGLQQHRFAMYDVTVPRLMDKELLENKNLWVHIARRLQPGSEVRVIAEDCSFRAVLLCTYAEGSETRMKVVEYTALDAVDYDEMSSQTEKYQVKQKGILKWCIVNMETGENIKEKIPTQAEATRELMEYKKALAS